MEVYDIFNGSSAHHRPTDSFDFTGFVFLHTTFSGKVFLRKAIFSNSTITYAAEFFHAQFMEGASFAFTTFDGVANFIGARFESEAKFTGAEFKQRVAFDWARFTGGADFERTVFDQEADFLRTIFGDAKSQEGPDSMAVANFRFAEFYKPELIRFIQVNQEGRHGLRALFAGCNVEKVQFEDVNWNRERGRVVLQDEIDVRAKPKVATSYARVAITYCQLINNFDRARAYDLAEDCSIGAMEMKRLDSTQPIFVRGAVNIYRWASNYGSSYPRALGVLALMVLGFGLLYSLAGLTPRLGQTVLEPAGFIHAVEVATFKSETHAIAGSGLAWFLEIFERILIPAQVALFLLALRRRFRR